MSDELWLDGEQWIVSDDEPEIGRPYTASGPILHLEYGDGSAEHEAAVCNRTRIDAVVCRVFKGHPGPHIPFAVDIAFATRVLVSAIIEQ